MKVILLEDDASFTAPYKAAWKDCAALLAASRPVAGAEAAFSAAQDDYDDLERFDAEMTKHLDNATFHTLPLVVRQAPHLQHVHRLDVGPFRGVFLVGIQPTDVAALMFSRKPHDTGARLDELARGRKTP